ncbi:hypothetical protein V5O48_011024 [Marasmius crinis-equi]|uniref:GPI anchored protein n=1 Tax=Marasmius crinis-equi TaxID=585013 RepID=A0ABR3F6U3_9AGAR
MKSTIVGFLALIPLLAQAADITLVGFVPTSDATDPIPTSAMTAASIVAVPIGTSGAETTYLIDVGDSTEITTTVSGTPTTTTSPVTNTIAVSASGYKGQSLEGFEMIDCHYTGDKVGECIYVIRDSFTTETAIISGTAIDVVVHISDKAGGASQTSGGSGSSPSGNSTSNDKNGAMSVSPGGMGAMALGGLLLGALVVF